MTGDDHFCIQHLVLDIRLHMSNISVLNSAANWRTELFSTINQVGTLYRITQNAFHNGREV